MTTAVAFWASYISSISAIKCFSIFAGLSILSNFVLMVTWMPACLVFYQRYCHASCCCCLKKVKDSDPVTPDHLDIDASSTDLDTCGLGQILCSWRARINTACRNFFVRFLPDVVIRMRMVWICTFTLVAVASLVIVLYYPGLKLPDQEHVQLFPKRHLFEK